MPELPEVEHARRVLERVAVGRRVEVARCADDPIVFEGRSPREFSRAVRGRTVAAARRRGKHAWLELDGAGPAVLIHLGMTGQVRTPDDDPLRLESSPREVDRDWPPRFWKLLLRLDDGGEVAVTNARRLGRIRLRDDPESEPPISRLGFDPLLDMPTPGRFRERLRARRGALKAVLLDQAFVAGVGNWIADEVLYQAGVDPRRTPASLDDAEIRRVHAKLRAVVRRACEADADKARFPRTWLFHARWGRVAGAVTPRGEPIEHLEVAGRTTAFVPSVQR